MTHYPDLAALTKDRAFLRGDRPVALLFVEDGVAIDSTISHHLALGFGALVLFCAAETCLPDARDLVHRVDFDVTDVDAVATVVNAVIAAAPGQWFYYGYNAEYLFYPFSEDRSVGEMLGFVAEERRDVVASYVVDLYAGDLTAHPTGVALQDAYFDGTGYYALARKDTAGDVLDRQMDVFGGLRWRFEEHVALPRRRIDRVSLFRAKPGLKMLPARTFSDPEYTTIACPWHTSLTAAVASFRTAKALRRNPGSRHEIDSFRWHQSTPFNWRAQQFLDLGLIEPGQWF